MLYLSFIRFSSESMAVSILWLTMSLLLPKTRPSILAMVIRNAKWAV